MEAHNEQLRIARIALLKGWAQEQLVFPTEYSQRLIHDVDVPGLRAACLADNANFISSALFTGLDYWVITDEGPMCVSVWLDLNNRLAVGRIPAVEYYVDRAGEWYGDEPDWVRDCQQIQDYIAEQAAEDAAWLAERNQQLA